MKRFLISASVALATIFSVSAQEASDFDTDNAASRDQQAINNNIWGKGRFTRLGYAGVQTCDGFSPVEKSKFGFFLTKGTFYQFPKQPIANLLKVGFDVIWYDLQFSKYQSPYRDIEWTNDFDTPSLIPDDEDIPGMDFLENITDNIGHMSLNMGVGIGPNVTIAPFALSDIAIMHPLKVSVYFHYSPTLGMYMRLDDGDFEMATGFVNMMDLGFNIQYRAIGIGMEGRWGNGRFKPLDFATFIGEESGSTHYTRKFANTRFYIQFRF